MMQKKPSLKKQRGETLWGVLAGLVLGLGIAFGIAIYVSKTPVFLTNRLQSETTATPGISPKPSADTSFASVPETAAPTTWDPNAALQSTPVSTPTPAPAVNANTANTKGIGQVPLGDSTSNTSNAGVAANSPPVQPKEKDDLADLASKKMQATSAVPTHNAAAIDADRVPAASKGHVVQVAAFTSAEDARAQRAQLVLLGFESTLSQKQQLNRTIYRVRLGPYKSKEEAEQARLVLNKAGFSNAVVLTGG